MSRRSDSRHQPESMRISEPYIVPNTPDAFTRDEPPWQPLIDPLSSVKTAEGLDQAIHLPPPITFVDLRSVQNKVGEDGLSARVNAKRRLSSVLLSSDDSSSQSPTDGDHQAQSSTSGSRERSSATKCSPCSTSTLLPITSPKPTFSVLEQKQRLTKPHRSKSDISAHDIPRPPNSFILYRSAMARAATRDADDSNRGNHQQSLSKIIAARWKTEPEEIKKKYAAEAARVKAEHQRLYPDYKFKPRKPDEILRAKEERARQNREQLSSLRQQLPALMGENSQKLEETDGDLELSKQARTGSDHHLFSPSKSVSSENKLPVDSAPPRSLQRLRRRKTLRLVSTEKVPIDDDQSSSTSVSQESRFSFSRLQPSRTAPSPLPSSTRLLTARHPDVVKPLNGHLRSYSTPSAQQGQPAEENTSRQLSQFLSMDLNTLCRELGVPIHETQDNARLQDALFPTAFEETSRSTVGSASHFSTFTPPPRVSSPERTESCLVDLHQDRVDIDRCSSFDSFSQRASAQGSSTCSTASMMPENPYGPMTQVTTSVSKTFSNPYVGVVTTTTVTTTTTSSSSNATSECCLANAPDDQESSSNMIDADENTVSAISQSRLSLSHSEEENSKKESIEKSTSSTFPTSPTSTCLFPSLDLLRSPFTLETGDSTQATKIEKNQGGAPEVDEQNADEIWNLVNLS